MSKNYINKNGKSVTYAEVTEVQNAEVVAIGNYDRDLILRTKGRVRVQTGNKFYDLNLETSNSNDETLVLKVIDLESDLKDYSDGLIYVQSTKNLYIITKGVTTLVNTSNKNTSSNISNNTSNVTTPIEPDLTIEYIIEQLEQHYLSLSGGSVLGNVSISENEVENNALFAVYGTQNVYSENEFKGLLIANESKTHGGALFTNSESFIIQSINNNSPIILKSNSITGNNNTVIIRSGSVAINDTIDVGYSLSVGGSLKAESVTILDSIKSKDYDYVSIKTFNDPEGFMLHSHEDPDTGKDLWILEIDRIIEKYPVSKDTLEGIDHQKLLKSSLYINDVEILSTNSSGSIANISFSLDDTVEIGDIYIGFTYDYDSRLTNSAIITVLNIEEDSENSSKIINTRIEAVRNMFFGMKVVKIGNTTEETSNVLIDSIHNNIKIFSNINKITDVLLDNKIPTIDEINDIYTLDHTYLVVPDKNIDAAFGNLIEVVDEDFDLENPKEFGLYVKNAYIKGKASLDYLKLGDVLLYEDGELTLSSIDDSSYNKIIEGTDGLEGSGYLKDDNEKITIKHKRSQWVPKPDLAGNEVIANIIVDEYGHIVDWVIKTIDIPDYSSGGSGGSSSGGSGDSGGCVDCGCGNCQ